MRRPGKVRMPMALAAALALTFAAAARAEVVVTLADDTTLSVPAITYAEDRVVLSDGRSFPRAEIRKILYAKGARGWRLEPTAPHPDEYRMYLEDGRRLAAKYPGFDSYDVEDRIIFTWNPDGTTSSESRRIRYLAKEDAKGLAGFVFRFEEERSRYVFLALRSISKELTVREVSPDRIVAAPTDSQGASFSHFLTISGQIPEPAVGGLIEVRVRHEVFNPLDGKWWDERNYFQGTAPSARSSLTVRVPEGQAVNAFQTRLPEAALRPTVTTADGITETTWALGEMPAVILEPSAPPLGRIVPFVVVSPFFEREYLYDLETRLIGDHAEPDARVRAAAAAVVAGASSDDEKIARIYHHLQKNVRYVSVKGSLGSGYGGHPAWLTLENRFGDCIDKAILFTAMLRACGIESEIAVLGTRGQERMLDVLPILTGNHAITRVTRGGRSFYLDSTGSMLRYPSIYSQDTGVPAFLPKSRRVEMIPAVTPAENWRRDDCTVALDRAGNIQLDCVRSASGEIEASVRAGLTGIKEKDRREDLLGAAARLAPRGELLGYRDEGVDDLSQPVVTRTSFRLPDYVDRSGKLLFFTLPSTEVAWGSISLPARTQDLEISVGYGRERNYTVSLPPGCSVHLAAQPLELHTPWYDLSLGYEVSGRELRFRYRFDQRAVTVTPQEYPAYREGLLQAERWLRQKIFLVSDAGGAS